RRLDAMRLIAELLVDVAAWHLASEPGAQALENATQTLRKKVRARENLCVRALLKRYNFDSRDFPAHASALEGERWGMDLFHPQALKDVGIHVTKGAAAGAMAGATLDVFMAGISLGAATLLGAAAGGLWQGADKLGKRLLGRLKGYQELSVDDAVLRLLAIRQLALLRALEQRGHAALGPIQLEPGPADADADAAAGHAPIEAWRSQKLPEELLEARSQPQWSSLDANHAPAARREQVIRALSDKLARAAD
ncbi:MAG: DUF3482 domain-containing protein, partial [Pollutimonas bauzanensis]